MHDNKKKQLTDYTEGSIMGGILKMGVPSMLGFLSQNIYGLVDTYWVSRLPGKEAGVAAITFFGAIMWLFFSFNQLVGPGSVSVISRRYGEKAFDKAEKAIKETLILKLFFGFLFGIVGYFTVHWMLVLMGAKGEALQAGIVYGRIMFLGMGIMYATYSIYTAMRGVANPQIAMILMISSNVLNLILDPIMMFGYFGFPALGIEGAAVASVCSYSITFAVGAWYFYSGRTNVVLHLRGKERVNIASMWKLVKIGIPAWLGDMSFSSSRLIITPLIAAFGTEVVAAYGVAMQITHFGIMVLVGMGLGLSSLIGHNIGSGKLDRARKTANTAVMMGIGTMVVMALITFFFARFIVGLFFETPATIEHGVILLQIFAVSFPFFGAMLMMEEVHMGVGMNMPAMIMNIIHSWPLQVLPIFILTKLMDFGQVAIWWTMVASAAVSTIGFYFYYRRGKWLTHKV